MKKYTVYLREIRVVPVIIQAESVEQAEKLVLEGDGDYQNDKTTHSDLAADEWLDSMFEQKTEICEK
jgi:hypothetical protein